ncbi:MAG: RidA family protein [Bacteroidota bacterium]
MDVLSKLREQNLELPDVSTPGGSYQSVNVRGSVAYVAIQFPIRNGEFLYQGRLGDERTTEDGIKAMELSAVNVIAQIHSKIGFDRIEGLNHLDAYYTSVDGWDEAPVVVNGASDLFLNVLGEKGRHSRAIFGVHHLPRNFCVGLTTSFTLLNA